MKIIFSPSKSQDIPLQTKLALTRPLFEKQSDELQKYLQLYSVDELATLLKMSTQKVTEILERQKTTHRYPAVHVFSGTSFRQLSLDSYGKDHIAYIQSHLCILSAYYGVLRPYDGIGHYRLDMTNNIVKTTQRYKSLYDFWLDPITNYFSDEEVIINLASGEYSKMLGSVGKERMVHIHFLVKKDLEYKSISVLSKQQRGRMLDYMVINNITDPSDLKKYSDDGFQYNKTLSDSYNLYFTREY